jgi:hypothetical protein
MPALGHLTPVKKKPDQDTPAESAVKDQQFDPTANAKKKPTKKKKQQVSR